MPSDGGPTGEMTDSLADISDADRLVAEIGRLRAQIA